MIEDIKNFIEFIFIIISAYTLSPFIFGGILIKEIIKENIL
jgi:hypothetical protein